MVWNTSAFQLLIISATGGFTGLFTYSPTPGTGNLIASIAPAAGTDPYGNAYVAGIASYQSGTPAVNSQMTAGTIRFNEPGIFSAASMSSNAASDLILSSGQVHNTDNAALISLNPGTVGTVSTVLVENSALELEEQNVPAADSSVTAGPKLFGNLSGQAGYVSDTRAGDGNTYDMGRLTLISPGVTINSNVTPVTVFTHHLGVGTYYVRVWMVVANTTAADAASWGFAGSGGLAATGPMDFTSKTSGTATVGYGASGAFTTTFNNQGVAGSQGIEMQTTLTVTTAGTFSLQGLELVAGNTVTVAPGAVMMIYPVVAT